MTSDIAPKVAKYLKIAPNPKIAQNNVRAYCLTPLAMQLISISYAVCKMTTHD